MDLTSYADVHRYDGVALDHDPPSDRRGVLAVQPRDVRLLLSVWRYKFLTAPQISELHWPGRGPRASQRRLRLLTQGGYLARFRPTVRTGSFPWTYHLAREGHRLLQGLGEIPAADRFKSRSVHGYGHVLHELQLNAWVLAYCRVAGAAILSWEGETDIQPPQGAAARDLPDASGLRDARLRPVRPDAMLTVQRRDPHQPPATILVEFDRTGRVDKNFGKFRRYDTFLSRWWRSAECIRSEEPPFVLFICQSTDQREMFVAAADREVASSDTSETIGRRQLVFALERDMHDGCLEAWRLPQASAGPGLVDPEIRQIRLPIGSEQQEPDR